MNELIERRTELEQMTVIPSMSKYAEEWRKLAADFEAVGYTSNAENCWTKARYYDSLIPTGYTRTQDINYVVLTPMG